MAEVLRAAYLGPNQPPRGAAHQIAKKLIAEAGSLPPSKLSAAHVIEIDALLRQTPYAPSTRWNYSKALRQVLRWLWENHGAPKLDQHVRAYPMPRPRNVTVTDDERAILLGAAPLHLRLWLLLCSDLAIRSGTAIKLGPAHYNRQRGTLTFTTKCDEHLTLPTTRAIDAVIQQCDQQNPLSFVRQLWKKHRTTHPRGGPLVTMDTGTLRHQFATLRASLNFNHRVTLHDHRRTAAVAMLEATGDIREVQSLLGHKNLASTLWYLDHNLRPIKRSMLELIKLPHTTENEERTA